MREEPIMVIRKWTPSDHFWAALHADGTVDYRDTWQDAHDCGTPDNPIIQIDKEYPRSVQQWD